MSKKWIGTITFVKETVPVAHFKAKNRRHAKDVVKAKFKLPIFSEKSLAGAGILHVYLDGDLINGPRPIIKKKDEKPCLKKPRFKKPTKSKFWRRQVRSGMCKYAA